MCRFHRIVEIAGLALVPDLHGGSVARLVLPDADDLGVVAVGVRSRLQDADRRIHYETYDSHIPEVTGSSPVATIPSMQQRLVGGSADRARFLAGSLRRAPSSRRPVRMGRYASAAPAEPPDERHVEPQHSRPRRDAE